MGSEVHLTLVIFGGVVINYRRWIFVKQVLIGDVSNKLRGSLVMSLIAKIKQTMHNSGISFSL